MERNYFVAVLVGSMGRFQEGQRVAEDLAAAVTMMLGMGEGVLRSMQS
jgi:hypothetical protein